MVTNDAELLHWIGGMLKRIYTPTLTQSHFVGGATLPLNPFRVFQTYLKQFYMAISIHIKPESDIFGNIFKAAFVVGHRMEYVILLDQSDETCLTDGVAQRGFVNADGSAEEISQVPMLPKGAQSAVMNADTPPMFDMDSAALPSGHNLIQHMISKEPAHVDTVQLRRSTRSTRYDGFRISQPSDNKKTVSKVKARVIPAISNDTKTTAPQGVPNHSTSAGPDVPPPTSIPTIQCIGINLCGIPKEQLSPKKLLASVQVGDQSEP